MPHPFIFSRPRSFQLSLPNFRLIITSLFPILFSILTLHAQGQSGASGSLGAKTSIALKPAEAPSSSSTQQISESQLVGLPLNGRSYGQLATLQAGVSDPSGGSASRGGGSGSLNVVGGRSTSNTFLLDGTNIMDSDNQVPRSASGIQLGSDSVLRVVVLSNSYGAESGRGSGGVLNSITRSGTPQFHGSLFEYFRNSKMDARNFFDPDSSPPPFKRNQFGFSLTGPIVKDRTFFMGSYESLRDRLTDTNIDFFPDEPSRKGIILDASGKILTIVNVNPRVAPYLALMPLPNVSISGSGVGVHAGSQYLPTDESFLMFRIDHKFTERDSLFARYTFDDANSQSSEITFLWNDVVQSRQQYLTLVGSHIFSTRTLMAWRAAYTRPVSRTHAISLIDIPVSMNFVPGTQNFGQITIPALSPFGPSVGQPEVKFLNSFQYGGDVIMQRGRHALRVGGDLHRYRLDSESSFYKAGSWSFNTLESFLAAGPSGTSLTVGLPGSTNGRKFRQTFLGLYVNDDVRINPRLQLNLGLRYEFTSLIHDNENRHAYVIDLLRDTKIQVGNLFERNGVGTFAPRVGLRWAPWSGRSTVFQAGFGIYYDPLLSYLQVGRKSSLPSFQVVVNPNFDSTTTFPNALAAATLPGAYPPRAVLMDYKHTVTPEVFRYHFSFQQSFWGGWDLQAAYVGARGNHLLRRYEANLFPVPVVTADGSLFFPDDCTERRRLGLTPSSLCRNGAGAVNPAFGTVDMINTDAQSFFNSLQLTASRRLSHGLSAQATYAFSKSVDDDSTAPGTSSANQYGFDRTSERGLSDFNSRHRLTINFFWNLPSGKGSRIFDSKIASGIIGGWKLGGIVSFRTGTPFTVQINTRTPGYLFSPTRPNLKAGSSNNPVTGITQGCAGVTPGQKLGTPDLNYDPCAFELPAPGTLGSLGRNTLIGPTVVNADASLQKEFSIDSKRRLQLRMEMFNVLNHPNFNKNQGNTAIVFSGSSGRRNSTAGRSALSVTTARQLQFALRFSF